MPFDVGDVPFISADFLEFIAVFIIMGICFALMVALGQWWAR
jgi:hypothetical protein